ncbi:MAG: putative toxin-antitoxin system toxin component, PIN family [Bryobacteraceae bacterium]
MTHELVLDTNVLVAGLRSKRGASYLLLRLLAENRFRLNISVALALEYEDVLKRPGLLAGLTETEIDAFLDYLLATSKLAPSVPRLRPSLDDPDDERTVELAVQCGAIIVTHNKRDFVGARHSGFRRRLGQKFLRF